MTEILDEGAVSEIEARANAATEGPWLAMNRSDIFVRGIKGIIAVCRFYSQPSDAAKGHGISVEEAGANVEFVQHAREDIPALCATVKHLRVENERLRESDAQIAESFRFGWNSDNTFSQVAETIAAAIRARKES